MSAVADSGAGQGVKWVEVPPGALRGQGLAPYDFNASANLVDWVESMDDAQSVHLTPYCGDFVIDVLTLSEVRGPAAAAQELYRETEESKQARVKAAEERKAMFASAPAPSRRPTKRDRRLIHKFSGE